jgi:HEAT repeat protein
MRTLSDLFEQLESPAWDARVDAVKKLGDLPDPPALTALLSALYDEDTAVVRAATEVLLRRGDESAFEPLLRALNAPEPDVDVAEEIQNVLVHHPEPWFVNGCIAALEQSEDDEMREFAAEALGYPLHATNAVAVLEEALSDPSADVREAAKEALARLRPTETELTP